MFSFCDFYEYHLFFIDIFGYFQYVQVAQGFDLDICRVHFRVHSNSSPLGRLAETRLVGGSSKANSELHSTILAKEMNATRPATRPVKHSRWVKYSMRGFELQNQTPPQLPANANAADYDF